MTDYSQSYNKYLTIFNGYLEEIYSQLDKSAPKIIIDAMRYAVSGGGKLFGVAIPSIACIKRERTERMLNIKILLYQRFGRIYLYSLFS